MSDPPELRFPPGTAVVYKEHTLATVRGEARGHWLTLQVLHASVLRGATAPDLAVLLADPDNCRKATREDFDAFRVHGPEHYGLQAAAPDERA